MIYHHYAPNGWANRRTAEEKMHDEMNAKRKQWYGPNWHTLDFWGLPLTKEPRI